MTLPNMPLSSKVSSSKEAPETEKSGKPEGKVDPEKFRQVFEAEDRKDTSGAILDEEEIDPEAARQKKFNPKKTGQKPKKTSTGSIFDVASESPLPKERKTDKFPMPPAAAMAFSLPQEANIEQTIAAVSETVSMSQQIEKFEQLQEIIDKITQQVLQLEDTKSGETVTLIYMNDDTPFKGASIKLSEFDSSKGQFNITIDNLTQQAKQLIDIRAHQLVDKFNEMGYQVPNLIATTAKINERFEVPIPSGQKEQQHSSFAKKGDEEQSKREDKPKK